MTLHAYEAMAYAAVNAIDAALRAATDNAGHAVITVTDTATRGVIIGVIDAADIDSITTNAIRDAIDDAIITNTEAQ